MISVPTTIEPVGKAQLPVLRITPPSRWWELPFGELWDYRELLYFFVWRDIKIRYKQTAVGAAWAVIQPFLTMLVFSLFFGKLAHIPSAGLPYPIFYYSALLPWMYFAASLQNATNTIVENQRMITKVYFPRLVLPVSATLSGLVDFGVSFLMFLAMMVYYGIRPTPAIFCFPLFLLLALMTALGAGLWLSALNAIYRDVRYVLPFLVQFWMFASPVAYPSSLVPIKWRWVYGLNPMAGVIEGFRWSLTGHGDPPGLLLFASFLVVLAVLAGGLAFFQRMEATIADVV
ncbi:MAG TPA: ABC transporter permease [Terriglobales bacterium]|nr:ABC transporter permease [Terriglobales bacterium]